MSIGSCYAVCSDLGEGVPSSHLEEERAPPHGQDWVVHERVVPSELDNIIWEVLGGTEGAKGLAGALGKARHVKQRYTLRISWSAPSFRASRNRKGEKGQEPFPVNLRLKGHKVSLCSSVVCGRHFSTHTRRKKSDPRQNPQAKVKFSTLETSKLIVASSP